MSRQKAWKPDCGIETYVYMGASTAIDVVRRPGSPIAGLKPAWNQSDEPDGAVRRPGSPIAGLKLILRQLGTTQLQRQKAWKPDCGIETSRTVPKAKASVLSEGLEARLRD